MNLSIGERCVGEGCARTEQVCKGVPGCVCICEQKGVSKEFLRDLVHLKLGMEKRALGSVYKNHLVKKLPRKRLYWWKY